MRPYRETWRQLRVVAFLTLCLMMVMRLVWMELRTYNIEVDARGLITLRFLQETYQTPCSSSVWDSLGPTKAPVRIDRLSTVGPAGYWISSPGLASLSSYLCAETGFDSKRLVRMNLWFLTATLMFATLLSRILTGSWLMGLMTSVAILSRGRLLADVGTFSATLPLALGLMMWFTFAAHFLRTGHLLSLFLALLTSALGSVIDRPMVFLPLAFPLLILTLYRRRRLNALIVLRQMRWHRQMAQALESQDTALEEGFWAHQKIRFREGLRILLGGGSSFPRKDRPAWEILYKRHSFFGAMRVPFALWIFKNRRAERLSVISVITIASVIALMIAFSAGLWWTFGQGSGEAPFWSMITTGLGHKIAAWVREVWLSPSARIDTFMILSALFIILLSLRPPISGTHEGVSFARFFLLSALALFLGALIADYADALLLASLHQKGLSMDIPRVNRTRDFFLWVEPSLLVIGIASLWQWARFDRSAKTSAHTQSQS
jgi:hypothetical protein